MRTAAKGGMMITADQAAKEIVKETNQKAKQFLDNPIAKYQDNPNNTVVLQMWKYNMDSNPALVVESINRSYSEHLKEVRQSDPDFSRFRVEFDADNPQNFDNRLAELKRKGLID